MRTVVVVAHPDDETLWAGGYLKAHPGTDVICCSVPAKDPQRCISFFAACKMLEANPIIVAASSAYAQRPLSLAPAQRLAETYDRIITHNVVGEYGHPHHIAVHKAMAALKKPMNVFGYGVTTEGDPVSLKLKREVLSVYTSRPQVFERWSKMFDLSKEAFV